MTTVYVVTYNEVLDSDEYSACFVIGVFDNIKMAEKHAKLRGGDIEEFQLNQPGHELYFADEAINAIPA